MIMVQSNGAAQPRPNRKVGVLKIAFLDQSPLGLAFAGRFRTWIADFFSDPGHERGRPPFLTRGLLQKPLSQPAAPARAALAAHAGWFLETASYPCYKTVSQLW